MAHRCLTCAQLLCLMVLFSADAAAGGITVAKRSLRDATFLQTLSAQSFHCLSGNMSGLTEGDLDCGVVAYVEKLQSIIDHETAKKADFATVAKVGIDTTDYTSQFEHKIVKNIPYIGQITKNEFSAAAALSACITEYGVKLNDLSKDISILECSEKSETLLLDALMPKILANDYLPRWKSVRGVEDEDPILDYRSHWPAFLPLYDITPKVHHCPVGLHMVVWGAKTSVKVRLFERSLGAHVLKPSIGSDVPHYLQYEESGFSSTVNALPSAYTETTLEEGQFIFIPRTMVASFDAVASSDNNALLRSCFVDASNLKEVREMIAMEARVVPSSRVWLAAIDKMSFQSAMDRNPTERFIVGTAIPGVAAETVHENKSGRRNRGGGLRDLSGAASWSNLITSLTLPVPSTPVFKDVGLDSATVEWSSYFVPSSVDKTIFGFSLSICEALNKSSCLLQDLPNLIGKASAKEANAQIFQTKISKFLNSGVQYIARVNMYYGSVIGYQSDWSSIATTQSVTPPSVIPGTVSAVLLKDSSKAELTFKIPRYDGGSPVTGYNVFSKEMQKSHGFSDVRKRGLSKPVSVNQANSEVTVAVTHLAPGVTYVFFVSAENAAGSGPVSLQSNELETPWLRGKDSPSVYMAGHTHAMHALTAATPSFPLLPDGDWSPAMRLLEAKSTEESIALSDEGKVLTTIPAWRSHWNGNIDITAQAAWMDPVYGDSALKNANDLVGKIAVSYRGRSTFVSKARTAQMAGALGLIIVDDGACRGFDQGCVPGSSRLHQEGFASTDHEKLWDSIRLPVFLVLKSDWEKLTERWQESPAQLNKKLEPLRQTIRLAQQKQIESEATKNTPAGGEL